MITRCTRCKCENKELSTLQFSDEYGTVLHAYICPDCGHDFLSWYQVLHTETIREWRMMHPLTFVDVIDFTCTTNTVIADSYCEREHFAYVHDGSPLPKVIF